MIAGVAEYDETKAPAPAPPPLLPDPGEKEWARGVRLCPPNPFASSPEFQRHANKRRSSPEFTFTTLGIVVSTARVFPALVWSSADL